jgi:hypothetical protein
MTTENVWAIDLPEAWFISAVSDKGRPQFKRRAGHNPARRSARNTTCVYRVSWFDFIGGWVVEDLTFRPYEAQRFLFGHQPSPTYMAAILATEVELSNLK